MASIIKQTFTDMLAKAALVDGSVYAAVWNNHLVRALEGETFNFDMPAIFVEMINNPAINLGVQVTQQNVIWRIHILHRQEDAGDGTLDQNLDVFDTRDSVKVNFMGYSHKNGSPLQFLGEEQDYDHNNVYHYILDFQCAFIDTKGSPLDPDSTEWLSLDASGFDLDIIVDAETPYL